MTVIRECESAISPRSDIDDMRVGTSKCRRNIARTKRVATNGENRTIDAKTDRVISCARHFLKHRVRRQVAATVDVVSPSERCTCGVNAQYELRHGRPRRRTQPPRRTKSQQDDHCDAGIPHENSRKKFLRLCGCPTLRQCDLTKRRRNLANTQRSIDRIANRRTIDERCEQQSLRRREIVPVGRCLRRQRLRPLFPPDLFEQRMNRSGCVFDSLACQSPEPESFDQNSNRPNISGCSCGAGQEPRLLRRHPLRCADRDTRQSQLSCDLATIVIKCCESKVENRDSRGSDFPPDENVGWLQVAVNNSLVMNPRDDVCKLCDEQNSFTKRQRATLACVRDAFALDVFHHQIRPTILRKTSRDERGDSAPRRARECFPFAAKAFDGDCSAATRIQHLHRDGSAHVRVQVREPNRCTRAASDQSVDSETGHIGKDSWIGGEHRREERGTRWIRARDFIWAIQPVCQTCCPSSFASSAASTSQCVASSKCDA